jgi:hypothetical protein
MDSTDKTYTAVRCLTRLSSFLSFEDLGTIDSHLSRVFHHVCVQSPFAMISAWHAEQSNEENLNNSARLLLALRERGFMSIQLIGHHDKSSVDEQSDEAVHNARVESSFNEKDDATTYASQPQKRESSQSAERAFFIPLNCTDAQKIRHDLLSLSKEYNQPAFATTHESRLWLLDNSDNVLRMYTRALMKPQHIQRIWTAMCGRKISRVETGFLTGNPVSFCGMAFHSVGLQSDVPANLTHRAFQNVRDLINNNPHGSEFNPSSRSNIPPQARF